MRNDLNVRYAFLVLAGAFLLSACAPPARYVLVTERKDVDYSSGSSQRYICLTAKEAMHLPGLIGLMNKKQIRRYAETRRPGSDPLEDILFHLVRNDYAAVGTLLERERKSVPEGLALLLRADIAYEKDDNIPAERITAMYQQAYDVQSCELNRDLILLRIRQMRYVR